MTTSIDRKKRLVVNAVVAVLFPLVPFAGLGIQAYGPPWAAYLAMALWLLIGLVLWVFTLYYVVRWVRTRSSRTRA